MIVSDEQLQKDTQDFRRSPYSFSPSKNNWNTVLRLMHNIEKLPHGDTIRYLKECLDREIKNAYKNRDIKYLKKVFPTLENLVAHGSALWIMSHTSINKEAKTTPTEFMKEIFQAYDLDNHPEQKKQLLLQRGPNKKYAADFSHVSQYFPPESLDELKKGKPLNSGTIPDTRSSEEIEEYKLYDFLKEQIKNVEPEPTKEEIHRIGKTNYEDHRAKNEKQAEGTPVSAGYYIPDKNGNPIAWLADSIKETYPEIRLRNVGDETKKEQACTLRDLDPNSNKSLVEQVIERADFPEDFYHHFNALSIWEKDYQQARQDPELFASIRYFIQNKGAFIFEDKADKDSRLNGKEGIGYAGYAKIGDKLGEHPLIVLRSDVFRKGSYLHELYHQVDLRGSFEISNQDITKYVFMLAQTNNNLQSATLRHSINEVDAGYPPSQFEIEMVAQMMTYTDRHDYDKDPLAKAFFETEKLVALSKADKIPAIRNRIRHALYDMPELTELKNMYDDFMQDKNDFYEKEEELKRKYSKNELTQKLRELNNEIQQKKQTQNAENEPKRARLEAALLKQIKRLNQDLKQIYDNREQIGLVILPPHIIQKYNKLSENKPRPSAEFFVGSFMPKEVSNKTLDKQIQNLRGDILDNNYPHIKFLRLYTTIETIKKLGYNDLPGIPSTNLVFGNFTEDFDELQSSPDKWNSLMDKLEFISEGLSMGGNKIDLKLACLVHKSIKELTDDDRLTGYLSRGIYRYDYDRKDTPEKFAQMFIQKLEENGYDPQKISDIVFNNVDDNKIIKDISFPKNRLLAGRILEHLDKNYDEQTLRLIANDVKQITPTYRKPCVVSGPDHIPIMFRSEYEAKKYMQEQENKQTKPIDNLKKTETPSQSNRLSKILRQNSEQIMPSSNITQNNNNNRLSPSIIQSKQQAGLKGR